MPSWQHHLVSLSPLCLSHTLSSHSPMGILVLLLWLPFLWESSCLAGIFSLYREGEAKQITPGCSDGSGELPNLNVFTSLQKEVTFLSLGISICDFVPIALYVVMHEFSEEEAQCDSECQKMHRIIFIMFMVTQIGGKIWKQGSASLERYRKLDPGLELSKFVTFVKAISPQGLYFLTYKIKGRRDWGFASTVFPRK